MKIRALTLFPKMFDCLNESVVGRAVKNGLIDIRAVDIREYTADKKHFKCDDTPYGGGAGMVMSVQPIYDCVQAVDPDHEYLRVYMSPKGETLTDKTARELAAHDKLLLLCGHYEGIDERAIELCVDREISIGDYVLSGGELAAMVVIDSVARFVDGVLGYPQYTRPPEFMGLRVPDVLLGGNHAEIEKYRRECSEKITAERRADLIKAKTEASVNDENGGR